MALVEVFPPERSVLDIASACTLSKYDKIEIFYVQLTFGCWWRCMLKIECTEVLGGREKSVTATWRHTLMHQ